MIVFIFVLGFNGDVTGPIDNPRKYREVRWDLKTWALMHIHDQDKPGEHIERFGIPARTFLSTNWEVNK